MTNMENLRLRIDEMRENGLINFNIFPGDKWNEYTLEERAGFVLEFLDAPRTKVDCVVSGKPKTDVRDLAARLERGDDALDIYYS